jgi:hypothetical protein
MSAFRIAIPLRRSAIMTRAGYVLPSNSTVRFSESPPTENAV